MEIKKSTLIIQSAPRILNIKNALTRSSAGKSISSMPKDVIKHVRMLLIQNGLSLEDIIIKYKEITNMQLKGTRVSDVISVLKNVQDIHLSSIQNASERSNMLEHKDTQEIAEYTRVTLKKTQVILERLQARRVNKNMLARSSTL